MQTGRHFVYVLIERALESDWSKVLSEVGGVRGEMKERGRGFTYTISKNLNGVPVLYPRVLFFLHGTVCSLCSISQCKILYWERVYLQDVAESNFWDSNLFPSGSVNIQYRHFHDHFLSVTTIYRLLVGENIFTSYKPQRIYTATKINFNC